MTVLIQTANFNVLCRAIRERLLVEFEYSGHRRIVAPYVHGTSKSGQALRAVQVGGESPSGGFGFGKLWIVSRMSNVRVTSESFVPDDPDYQPDDQAMLAIHCRV